MKRLWLISVLITSLAAIASGQYFYGGLTGNYYFPRTEFIIDSLGNLRFQKGDLGFSLQAGAMAGSDYRGNPRYGTFVSPALAYNVSSRFRIKTGVTFYQGFGNNHFSGFENPENSWNYNPSSTGIFVQGDYLLTNKIMLSGAVYKYFSPFNVNNPGQKGPDGESYLFNINYRPAKHFEINATFEYGNRTGSHYYDPFYQPGMIGP